MEKFWTFIRHERGAVTGFMIGIVFLVGMGFVKGCVEVPSAIHPDTMVTLPTHRQEAADIKAMADKWEISEDEAIEKLEKIDAVANWGRDTILGAIAGNFNPANSLSVLFVTAGGGSLADTYRKRRKIKKQEAEINGTA